MITRCNGVIEFKKPFKIVLGDLIMSDISFVIEDKFENIKHIHDEWDRKVAELCSPVYMSYDWCKLWWEFYGKGKVLKLYIFYYKSNIVSILPMFVDCINFGIFNIKIARLIGANTPPKVFNPPIDSCYSEKVLNKALKSLIVDNECDIVCIGPVSTKYKALNAMRNLKKVGYLDKIQIVNNGVYTEFNLPNSYKEYKSSLSRNEKKNFRKYELRYLGKKYNVKVDIVKKDILEYEYRKFVNMHTKQWKEKGRPGHFLAWPNAEKFNLALSKCFLMKDKLRLMRIIADDRPISYQYTYIFGDTYYWRLPARVTGTEWDKYKLGQAGIVNMIKIGINEGIKRIEGGIGHYEYKMRLGASEHRIVSIHYMQKRFRSKIKLTIYKSIVLMINAIYYKMWYRRLQPKLPKYLQRPISSLWIRIRL